MATLAGAEPVRPRIDSGPAVELHHAAFDGVSAWEAINVSHDTIPHQHEEVLEASELPASSIGGWGAPSIAHMGLRAYERLLQLPFDLAKTAWQSLPILLKLIKEDLHGFPLIAGEAPRTPLNGPLSPRRFHRKFPVSIADLKRIRSLVPDTTVNDAALAIIAGAMRAYLIAKKSLPKHSLKVGIPMSIRAPRAPTAPAPSRSPQPSPERVIAM